MMVMAGDIEQGDGDKDNGMANNNMSSGTITAVMMIIISFHRNIYITFLRKYFNIFNISTN